MAKNSDQQPIKHDNNTEDFSSFTLDNQLCFAIYSTMNRVNRLYNRYLEPLGITFSQYLTLLVLWEASPRSVREIGQALDSTFSTVSPLIQRLEHNGLVRRVKDLRDERRVLVHLTEEGANLRAGAFSARRKVVDSVNISDDEIQMLRQGLKRLSSSIDAAEPAR